LAVSVSVVIPAYNAVNTLSDTLEAIACQSYAPTEVIVVDDGSSDETADTVRQFAHERPHYPLRYLRQAHLGTGAARNRGWRAAAGEVVAFTDADAVPVPSWLEEGVKLFEDPSVAAVEGRVLAVGDIPATLYTHQVQNLSGGRFLTANMFYRRSVLEAVGGFRLKHREDSDLAFAVLERGYKIRFNPNTVVHHPPRQETLTFYFRIAERRLYEGALFRQHPQVAGQFLKKFQPTEILVTLGELVIVAGIVFGHRWPVILGLALLVVGLPRRVWALLDGRQHTYKEYLLAVALSLALVPVEAYWHLRGLLKPVPPMGDTADPVAAQC
jgi:glycosyltransferase involved in cell wall biosynthesis